MFSTDWVGIEGILHHPHFPLLAGIDLLVLIGLQMRAI